MNNTLKHRSQKVKRNQPNQTKPNLQLKIHQVENQVGNCLYIAIPHKEPTLIHLSVVSETLSAVCLVVSKTLSAVSEPLFTVQAQC
jgi:hypothetical protein